MATTILDTTIRCTSKWFILNFNIKYAKSRAGSLLRVYNLCTIHFPSPNHNPFKIPNSDVWSIKPNFKFKIPKCDQNFPCGRFCCCCFFFYILLRVELHVYTTSMQYTRRGQSYNCHKILIGLSMWGGGKFFQDGGHSFLDFDDA